MIKLENIQVYNFEGAIRGMRNPLNSWDQTDSYYKDGRFIIGDKDLSLAQRLILSGNDHRKFMRQIFLSVDITAPRYWWPEMDQYKISTTTNSCSTMHTIMKKEFSISDFSVENLRGYKKDINQYPNIINEETEEWKIFPLNNNYLVSNQGRVKRLSYKTTNNATWQEKILTNTLTTDGYLKVGIKINNEQKDRRVHQLVALTFLENPFNYTEVNHKNGNKLDNRVENIEWCSSSQNQKHAVENNLQPINITTYKGKLDKAKRDIIISEYNNTDKTTRELALEYSVSHTTISSIINNKYNYGEGYENEYEKLLKTIQELNELRDEWLITKDNEVWEAVIKTLPQSYNQRRTWTGDYEVARNQFFARRAHKLSEWHTYCDMLADLPYGQELICIEN